ncbi:MAG: 3-oxoacid CoA-transferase subunit A [Thalassovita sp.]
MIDKFSNSVAEAIGPIQDGSTVLMGGFGAVGQADQLIEGLIATGAKDLTVVANNAGHGKVGLARLLEQKRVRKLICSFPRIAGSTIFETLYEAGELELELVPQGTLAERMRAAGAGIPAFYTATSVGTPLAEGKPTIEVDGKTYVRENALYGDLALVEAWTADRWGNLTYRQSGRNFNPVMATAARQTVVQVHKMAELGEIDPEAIVTPGIFVDRIIHIPQKEWDV